MRHLSILFLPYRLPVAKSDERRKGGSYVEDYRRRPVAPPVPDRLGAHRRSRSLARLGRMCPKSADGGTRDRRERSSSHRRRRHYRTRPCSPVESSVRSETGIEHHLPLTVYRVEDGLAHLAQPRGEIGCRLYRRHLAGHHWRLAHAALREVGRRRRVSGLLRRLRRAVRSLPRYSRRGQVHRLDRRGSDGLRQQHQGKRREGRLPASHDGPRVQRLRARSDGHLPILRLHGYDRRGDQQPHCRHH